MPETCLSENVRLVALLILNHADNVDFFKVHLSPRDQHGITSTYATNRFTSHAVMSIAIGITGAIRNSSLEKSVVALLLPRQVPQQPTRGENLEFVLAYRSNRMHNR